MSTPGGPPGRGRKGRGPGGALAAALHEGAIAALAGVREETERTDQVLAGEKTGHPRLPLADIFPEDDNPRRTPPTRDEIDEMKRSILAVGGLLVPLTLYRHPARQRWTVKYGHTRRQALEELVAEGHAEFRMVPIFIEDPPEDTPAGRRRHLVTRVIENNVRQGLTPLDTAEQYAEIAGVGDGSALTAPELAELTGGKLRTVQRYLFVVAGLNEGEREAIREGYPDAGVVALEALVKWLQNEGRGLDAGGRMAAVQRFVTERPSEQLVRVRLKDLAQRKQAGRPARKRFTAGPTKSGAFQVKLTLPPALTRDRTALLKAREDLLGAAERLDALARELPADE